MKTFRCHRSWFLCHRDENCFYLRWISWLLGLSVVSRDVLSSWWESPARWRGSWWDISSTIDANETEEKTATQLRVRHTTPRNMDSKRCCFCRLRLEVRWWAQLTCLVDGFVSFPFQHDTSIVRSGSLPLAESSDTTRWFVLLLVWRFPEAHRWSHRGSCRLVCGTIGCWWRCRADPSCPQKLHRRTERIRRHQQIGFPGRKWRVARQATNLWMMKTEMRLNFGENHLPNKVMQTSEKREKGK